MTNELPKLTIGSLAYLDAFIDGLVPCKVVEIRTVGGSSPHCEITAEITATRRVWKRGERITRTNLGPCPIIPREAIYTTFRGAKRIGMFNVVAA